MRVKLILFILFFSISSTVFANTSRKVVNNHVIVTKKIVKKVPVKKSVKRKSTVKLTKKNKTHLKHKTIRHAKKHDYMNGIASYYGGGKDGFDGKQMANGDYFDSSAFTAAHPTVALGTKLKVTNLSNHRSVYVEVTDRMPKTTGRVIDLSYGVARYLGSLKSGIIKVKLQKVTNSEYAANRDNLLLASSSSTTQIE